MSIAYFFIDERKPVVKRLFVANEDDYLLVQRCFPEPGFVTYLAGLQFKLLAQKLRQHGINSATDRLQHSDFASFTRAVSCIDPALQTNRGHERRGTGEAHSRIEKRERVSSEFAKACLEIERCEKENLGIKTPQPRPIGSLSHVS